MVQFICVSLSNLFGNSVCQSQTSDQLRQAPIFLRIATFLKFIRSFKCLSGHIFKSFVVPYISPHFQNRGIVFRYLPKTISVSRNYIPKTRFHDSTQSCKSHITVSRLFTPCKYTYKLKRVIFLVFEDRKQSALG